MFLLESSLHTFCLHIFISVLQSSIRNIELLANRLPQPMMAMAVPNAMDKQISQLIEEIEGDHDTRLQQPAAP